MNKTPYLQSFRQATELVLVFGYGPTLITLEDPLDPSLAETNSA